MRIPGYAERAHTMAEIDYCDRVFLSIPGIRAVNVTNRSIEETSDWITHHLLSIKIEYRKYGNIFLFFSILMVIAIRS